MGESKTTINKSVCNCCGAFASHLTAHQGQKRHRDALVRSCPDQFHLPSAISGTAPWMDISNPLLRGALSSLFTLSRLLPRPMETSFNRKTVSSSSGPSRHVPGMTIKGYPPPGASPARLQPKPINHPRLTANACVPSAGVARVSGMEGPGRGWVASAPPQHCAAPSVPRSD